MLAGHLQAKLIRTGGPDEIVEARDLTLPAEPAEPAVGQRAHPSLDFGEVGERALLGFAQDVSGIASMSPRRRAPVCSASPSSAP